jgi:L-lactate dehydrogenase complex protein LldG
MAREAFLQRVREAVNAGNRAAPIPSLPPRGKVGYQGAGTDPVQRFCKELANAGGVAHVVSDREAAWRVVHDIVRRHSARRILLGSGGLLDRLGLHTRLREAGLEVATTDALTGPDARETMFAADVGISNVHNLIAETGTVVMATRPLEPRSLSLLPPVHIAFADRSQLLPDLFDLFDLFSPVANGASPPPACLSLITGPSKTGDIELKLVTGVHGPGEVHVVLVDG